MKVYRSLSEIRLRDTTIAIGVFDGVHRGHQKVLIRAKESARQIPGGQSVALTFDRHPAELVAPEHAPSYLSTLSQRVEMIAEFSPVDAVVIVPFDINFASLSAHDFVKDVLVDRLGALRIFVGADFRYGKGRAGGVMDLEAAGEAYHFGVDVVHSVAEHGERVSSTRIRALVAAGDVAAAHSLLGHPFSLRGSVVYGKQLGRTLGFPTANLEPDEPKQLLPSPGVYAARVLLSDANGAQTVWPAAVSVGLNPTTDKVRTKSKVEAFIMGGFHDEIYGSAMDIEFVERLRGEKKFDSLEALVQQIAQDVRTVEGIIV
jgi:riboflavin kinase/FMN adenylyltransferase